MELQMSDDPLGFGELNYLGYGERMKSIYVNSQGALHRPTPATWSFSFTRAIL